MDRKVVTIIIVVIGLGVLFLFNSSRFQNNQNNIAESCMPEGQDIYYCNNESGAVKYKVGMCADANTVGTVHKSFCPKSYNTYFLDGKKVSEIDFFNRINEVNQSCNCIVEVYQPVR